jgi:hypothetical protein
MIYVIVILVCLVGLFGGFGSVSRGSAFRGSLLLGLIFVAEAGLSIAAGVLRGLWWGIAAFLLGWWVCGHLGAGLFRWMDRSRGQCRNIIVVPQKRDSVPKSTIVTALRIDMRTVLDFNVSVADADLLRQSLPTVDLDGLCQQWGDTPYRELLVEHTAKGSPLELSSRGIAGALTPSEKDALLEVFLKYYQKDPGFWEEATAAELLRGITAQMTHELQQRKQNPEPKILFAAFQFIT